MKIQVISYDKVIRYGEDYEYTYSSLNAPMSFDAFDLNIISLQTPGLWVYDGDSTTEINSVKDFESLHCMITATRKSTIIVCFPQNNMFHYCRSVSNYRKNEQLKNMITALKSCLSYLLPGSIPYSISYENAITMCSNTPFKSAFYFHTCNPKISELTKCIGSEHITTFSALPNIIYTTLDLSNKDTDVTGFLESIDIIKHKTATPEWIMDYVFFDDEKQRNIVKTANEEIELQNRKIIDANKVLDRNMRYKSILYENGEQLVNVVFEILEDMLKCDLSEFVDKKLEDFRIICDDITFIGEIKGINTNVKSENVSQLDVHCSTYIDKLDEEGKNENVKGLLIVNPLRTKPLNAREEVHDKQIALASRHGSLIITTETLLYLYEAYLHDKISTVEVIELLKNKVGILNKSDVL